QTYQDTIAADYSKTVQPQPNRRRVHSEFLIWAKFQGIYDSAKMRHRNVLILFVYSIRVEVWSVHKGAVFHEWVCVHFILLETAKCITGVNAHRIKTWIFCYQNFKPHSERRSRHCAGTSTRELDSFELR